MGKDTNNTKGRADHIDQLVSRRLKTRRQMLGLSQHDLSSAVDVSIQQVQKYEKATNRISSGKLHAFAKVLQVPVDYFFDNSDDSSNTIGRMFAAEESDKYVIDHDESVNLENLAKKAANKLDAKYTATEREIISLVKAFNAISNPNSRKKIIELIKSIS